VRFLTLAFIVAVLGGCESAHIHRLTDHKYPPKSRDAEIEAFFGAVERPHERIALIDSQTEESKDDEAKARMLEQLRQKARKLGADAVADVRLLSREGTGWVWDEATPFPAPKQGPYNLFFLRGEAIKYIDPSVDLAEPARFR
jgi:hypothetical protein